MHTPDQPVELNRFSRAAHPERCAITFRGVDISHAVFDERIRRVGGWLAAQGIGADDVLRAELECMT